MRFLCLDLAARSGWTLGDASAKPTISAWKLRRPGQPPREAARKLGQNLRDMLMLERVDAIVVESFLNPVAQPSADAIIMSLLLHGAVECAAACYDIPVKEASPATVRAHFCGQTSAAAPRARNTAPRTAKQKAEDRHATKMMVWRRAVALGYFDRGATPDFDMADSVALFDWAAHTIARASRPLVMFGSEVSS